MSLDLLSLDIAFEGLPFDDTGPESNTSLDVAFEGLPFTYDGPAVVAATVATSQAQFTLSASPIGSSASTAQAQGSAAALGLGWDVAASTAQGQGAQAQAKAHTPWQLVTQVFGDSRSADPTITPFALAGGDHVVVSVFYGAYTNRADGSVDLSSSRAWTLAVSDTAGNTYVALPPVRDQVAQQAQSSVSWMQQFYCVNAVGSASNTVTVTPISGPSGAYAATVSPVISSISVLNSGGAAAEYDTSATAASTSNGATTLSLPAMPVQPGACVLYDSVSNSNNIESVSGWTAAGDYLKAWFAWWRPNNQPASQTTTVTGDGGIRVLAGVSLRNATGALLGTRQAQSSSAAAEIITTFVDGAAATAQGQHAAASAASAADTAVATRQGQRTAAMSGAVLLLSATTAQAQAASLQGDVFQPGTTATSQAQASSAEAGVAVAADVTSQQVQAAALDAGVGLDALAQLVQVQTAGADLEISIDAATATSAAQQAAGALASAYVLDVATAQQQQGDAVAGVDSSVQASGAQVQGASSVAEIITDASALSRQAQRMRVQARAESVNELESGQVQHTAGTLGLSSDAPAATRQRQAAALLAGVAIDTLVDGGQVQHIGDGNVLVVSVDAVATTAQEQQHAEGVLELDVAAPGTLSLDTKRLHPAQQGAVRAVAALDAEIRVRTVLGGRVDLRPVR